MEFIEILSNNFWLIIYLILLCISGTPGIATLIVAGYIAIGYVPGWLYVVTAIAAAVIHAQSVVNKWEAKKKNRVMDMYLSDSNVYIDDDVSTDDK